MKEIRRKKTFGRVFYESYKKEFHIAGIALSIIAAITIIAISAVIFVKLRIFSGIFNFLFDGNNFSFAYKVFITFWIEILSLFIILLLVMQLISLVVLISLISGSIINGIYNFISKCKTMKRYADLPITSDEVRALIDKGIITTDRDYTYYLVDRLICKEIDCVLLTHEVIHSEYCWSFTNEDMVQLINTYREVFNKPIIVDKDYYYKYKIYSGTCFCPFDYKGQIDYLDDYYSEEETKFRPVVFTDKNTKYDTIKDAHYIYIDNE